MKLSKLHLIALLVGTVAVVGCKDEGGTGGTAGAGGTGGGIDTGCDQGRCVDDAQATKCDEEILACVAAEPANETACTVFGNVLFCSEGGSGGAGGDGGAGGNGGAGGEGGTGGAIDVSCDEGRCLDVDQADKCEKTILACIAAKPANEEQCIALGNLVFCDEDVLVPVFVTRGTTDGNLGGLAGGDTFCTEAATTADLPGLWTAWLSTSPNGGTPVAAIERISDGKYVRLDATVVANEKQDLIGDPPMLNAPINVQEDVRPIQAADDDIVWTGTNAEEGNWLGATDCLLWTVGDNTADAQTGQANAVDEAWTDAIPLEITCDNTYRLYCFADTGSN